MSAVQTALALIAFGFTIFQLFQALDDPGVVSRSAEAARNFGMSLAVLGVGTLALSIVYHGRFMLELRAERKAARISGLIHAESRFPASLTLFTAICLLAIGIVAIASMLFHVGPFG